MAITNKKHIIIAETHRAFNDTIKDALDARCLSCTFLPFFSNGVKNIVRDIEQDIFTRISNMKALKYDGISQYELEKKAHKEYYGDLIALVLSLYNQEGTIFLAHDNDAGGNLMASILYHKLIAGGIQPENIIRVLGIEESVRDDGNGIDIYVGKCYDENRLIRILERTRRERKFIYEAKMVKPILGKGVRNITALYETIQNKLYNGYVERESEGVCLATYLTKYCLNEQTKTHTEEK